MKAAAVALTIFAIALAIFVIAQSFPVSRGRASELPERDQKELIARADGGAAELAHTDAQRSQAYMIVKHGSPHEEFGKTPKEAVLKLLTEASKTNESAACELGEYYYQGYFGEDGKHAKAREAFQLAASLHSARCWEYLAKMLHKGEGGDADPIGAYYYICLDTQWTHPDSFGGKEFWVLRREIEEDLTLAQAKEVWKRVDAYLSKERKRTGGRIYPARLLGTGIPEERWNEALKTTDEFEARHRNQLETTMRE